MNEEKIARLEGLLERVRARAAMPRRSAALGAPPPAAFAAAPKPDAPVAFAAPTPPAAFDAPPVHVDVPDSEPSSIEVSASELTEIEASEVEIEVSSEVVEVEVDVDVDVEISEPALPVARKDLESGAQRVAVSSGFEADEPVTSELAGEVSSFDGPEPLVAAPLANEIEDEPPLSSRRPVAVSEPPVETYASAPRHTPPPESGKQVAVSSMPADRAPSVSAPSGEDAFVSGWREPGLASQPPREVEPPLSTRTDVRAESAEIIAPALPEDAPVARVDAAAPAFVPRSFGELLDATLAL